MRRTFRKYRGKNNKKSGTQDFGFVGERKGEKGGGKKLMRLQIGVFCLWRRGANTAIASEKGISKTPNREGKQKRESMKKSKQD